ncbi:Mor transcription activator family protein [Variovorax boronicumulans]|uniref:Mor transcription activator family protein n=1 Tax=Variovorax boronicumulans TaxID=436515 RepID=UPI001C56F4CA
MSAETRMGEKRNELLADLVQLAERVLRENEVTPAAASTVACALADRLAAHWGGQMIYIPADFQWKLAQVELEIYDAFNGSNYIELARRHGMTESGLRRLIARVRAKLASFRHEQQLDMLDAPPEL